MQNKFLVHNDEVRKSMLETIGLKSTDELFSAIDAGIRLREDLDLPNGLSEIDIKQKLVSLSTKNDTTQDKAYFLGGGCYNKFSPACISYLTQRSEFLTAYTPYQPEISQGSLQSIYEYQTMICNITGMDLANAGVYDGATACAESLLMACRIKKKNKVLVASTINPEYLKVVKTYLHAGNIEYDLIPMLSTTLNIKALENIDKDEYAGVLVQYPNYFGDIENMNELSIITKELNSLLVVAANPSSLFILKSPKDFDADIVVGDIQSLGLSMASGGAGYMATKKEYMRQIPGRIVGATVDRDNKVAYTLTQQAREQHIRRDKATSNICSNQALSTLSSTIYLSLMGFDGVAELEQNAIQKAQLLAKKISEIDGFQILNKNYLNEFIVKLPQHVNVDDFLKEMAMKNIFAGIKLENEFSNMKNCILVTVTELNSLDDIYKYVSLLKDLK